MKVKDAVATYRIPRKMYAYQDYLKLPADGNRYEVIEGELIMTPAPYTIHQRVSRKIVYELISFVEKEKIGELYYAPIDVLLSNINVVQPDILFISNQNFHIITEKNIKGTPDLIIEIISPSTGYYDLIAKQELYEKFGVKEYWLVDPKKQRFEIYENMGQKFELNQRIEREGIITSQVLKGLQINVKKIFDIE